MGFLQQERDRLKKLSSIEEALHSQGYTAIAGVDEAGRGPLAGPVVAAACILPEGLLLEGIDDSKKLLPSQRFALFEKIKAIAEIHHGIGIIDALVIDQINILQATFQAMLCAIAQLNKTPDYLLIDGNKMPKTPIPGEALIKGDSRCQAIAAASIIAKETRDALMLQYHEQWPQYNFLENKGYGTKEHLRALLEHGPCPIHRMTFQPIKRKTALTVNELLS